MKEGELQQFLIQMYCCNPKHFICQIWTDYSLKHSEVKIHNSLFLSVLTLCNFTLFISLCYLLWQVSNSNTKMVTAFVDGWDFVQTLGEGAYGEVKLAVNQETQEAVAVKIIDLTRTPTVSNDIRKEVCIHKMVSHENIIKFYGNRKSETRQYLFLEYACGGELFDRIEPDVGMPHHDAQRFYRQLIAGVEYLHSKGIVHRDLKPENLLLDEEDNLKITDFGLATCFRHQGKERTLETCCGTAPYVAPEVIAKKPYKAQPMDIWSCGIILVALLAGELPWDKPTYDCKEYVSWKDCKITMSPWCKIDNLALSLLRKILVENTTRRATVEVIRNHQWFNKNFLKGKVSVMGSKSPSDLMLGSSTTPFKRQCTGLEQSPCMYREDSSKISMSQPEAGSLALHQRESLSSQESPSPAAANAKAPISFSQPVHLDHMLLGSQIMGTPGASQTPMQRLVRRMTRFFVKTNASSTASLLVSKLEKSGYSIKKNSPGMFTITTMDRRKMTLTFKACLIEMNDNLLVDFRLSKGDGIEFKKHFMRIRDQMTEIINKKAIVMI